MTTPADEIRAAVNKLRAEAAQMPPAPDLTREYPDIDAAAAHVQAGHDMRINYAVADLLDEHLWIADNDPHNFVTAGDKAARTLARAINATA